MKDRMMLTFAILSDHPIPLTGPYGIVYPFREMEVGQCAVFKIDDPNFHEMRIRKIICAHFRRHGQKFTARLDRPAGVFRVWRIK